MHQFYVYIARCADSRYYVGVTNDYLRRIAEHNDGINAKCYTFTRRPVELVYVAHFDSVLQAIIWEKTLKKWSRKKKEAVIRGEFEALPGLSARRLPFKKNTVMLRSPAGRLEA